jgi:hypothetical protein
MKGEEVWEGRRRLSCSERVERKREQGIESKNSVIIFHTFLLQW